MPIKILKSEVASQIAAGEVIERPASVVKELIENAIDAGSSRIVIHCLNAGQGLIEVRDNGRGIPIDQLELAVTRHATSKLETAEELFQIRTLGFRGEALASIASVSRLTIVSKEDAAEIGGKLQVEGGLSGSAEPSGAPTGTLVRVEDLFFNVPARRKFLKTDLTERRHIDETVTNYALAFPEIQFNLSQEHKQALQTSGSGDRREITAAIFGTEIARQMLELLAQEEDIGINGLISPVSLTRSNRRAIQFFVNGRPVQDYTLTTALLQGYHTLLMAGRFPIAQIFLTLPAEQVDVNVHPTKAEVRFRQPDEVFAAVQRATRRALLAYTPVPELRTQYRWHYDGLDRQTPSWGSWDQLSSTQGKTDSEQPDIGEEEVLPSGSTEQERGEFPGTRSPLLRLVGQVAAAYLIAEGPDGLYLIDQHAAHERVLFERFMSQKQDKIPSQRLLEPETVAFSPASSRLLEAQLQDINRLGFEVENFGRHTFIVRAIPVLLAGMEPAGALRVLVEDFEEDESPLQNEIEAKIIARVCKRAAVKAGQVLSAEEQQALLYDLEKTTSPRTCPHGRPTMIHLSVNMLERQFGRSGPR